MSFFRSLILAFAVPSTANGLVKTIVKHQGTRVDEIVACEQLERSTDIVLSTVDTIIKRVAGMDKVLN